MRRVPGHRRGPERPPSSGARHDRRGRAPRARTLRHRGQSGQALGLTDEDLAGASPGPAPSRDPEGAGIRRGRHRRARGGGRDLTARRTVFVTGAAYGIGAPSALALAGGWCDVAGSELQPDDLAETGPASTKADAP